VGPVPDSLLLRKSGSVGNRTRTSDSVARNSDHYNTEEVPRHITDIKKKSIPLVYSLLAIVITTARRYQYLIEHEWLLPPRFEGGGQFTICQ
jgi:hypothetical protein